MRTAQIIIGFAANLGVPPPDLLCAARMDPALVADPDGQLLHLQEMRLWEEAIRLTGDADFGLHLAEWAAGCPEDLFDVLTFAVRSSPTLRDLYQLVGRYMRLIHEGVYLSLEEEGDVARLVHGHVPERVGPRHPVEGMLALTLLHGRHAIGEEFAARSVCFTHAAPERITEQERVFKAPLRYACPRNELVLDRALLDREQPRAEARLLPMLDGQLGGLLSRLSASRRLPDEVKRRMSDTLPDGEPALGAIAGKMHMSARSLQRRLQSEGTSFSEVLSDLRCDLALRYLQDSRMSVGDVGFVLGFLDATAFHRAFKRWTGSTPTEHRRASRPT